MFISKHFLNKQFILFLVVGCMNTFNGVLFSALFNVWLSPTIAFILGYGCSVFISYVLNSYLVFKHKLELLRFLKFVLSNVPNFVIQLISVYLLIRTFNIHPILVYTVAAIIGVPITFLVMKLYAFKTQSQKT